MGAFDFGLRRRICALAVALVAALCCCVLCVGGVQQAWADDAVDLGEPLHEKTLESNGDGTYNLTLNVTGKSQASSESTNANVIVVLDTSGSMSRDVESYVYVKTRNGYSSDPRYGLTEDNEYVKLSWVREGLFGGHWELSGEAYTGDVYKKEKSRDSKVARIAAAKEAVNGLADSLLGLNTEDNPGAVQMALVTFSNKASVHKFSGENWTSDVSGFKSAVNALKTDGGTNWEDALSVADGIEGDEDPTYVVFVSDGDPTYYNSDNEKGYAGIGSSYDQTAYDKAAVRAKAIVEAGKSFYAVAAFGGADDGDLNAHMRSLVNDAYSNGGCTFWALLQRFRSGGS